MLAAFIIGVVVGTVCSDTKSSNNKTRALSKHKKEKVINPDVGFNTSNKGVFKRANQNIYRDVGYAEPIKKPKTKENYCTNCQRSLKVEKVINGLCSRCANLLRTKGSYKGKTMNTYDHNSGLPTNVDPDQVYTIDARDEILKQISELDMGKNLSQEEAETLATSFSNQTHAYVLNTLNLLTRTIQTIERLNQPRIANQLKENCALALKGRLKVEDETSNLTAINFDSDTPELELIIKDSTGTSHVIGSLKLSHNTNIHRALLTKLRTGDMSILDRIKLKVLNLNTSSHDKDIIL